MQQDSGRIIESIPHNIPSLMVLCLMSKLDHDVKYLIKANVNDNRVWHV